MAWGWLRSLCPAPLLPPRVITYADWAATQQPPVLLKLLANLDKWNDAVEQNETQTVDSTLAERGARYGDFTIDAMIADQLISRLATYDGWSKLDNPHRHALRMIMTKIARIMAGDPHYRDNWLDIQGYAKLAEDRCKP